jgi:DNA-3-methyladenine glycosylase
MSILPLSYFQNPDVVFVAKDLIGKVLVTNMEGGITSGIIVETEAYSGTNDKACHANNGKRTPRNEIMYHAGGHTYVYLCYGIHHLFNIVTNVVGKADAVLIRGIQPLEGISIMQERRLSRGKVKEIAQGPGVVSKSLGIITKMNGLALDSEKIWVEDRNIRFSDGEIWSSPRIGVDYAGEDALKPWRFFVKKFYSK